MRRPDLLLTTAVAAALCAGAAWAQDAAVPQTPGAEEEIVVTAAPFAINERELTSNVDVLRREELDLKQMGGLGEVLSDLPGLRSTAFGAGASRPVIRGLAGPRVQVLTNGVGLIDASSLSPDHAVASDPSEAQRIEVLRGPSALAYGGSAIGGVVNIIDERIPTTPATGGADGRVAAQASSVDQGRQLAASLKVGPGPWVVALDAVRRETEDYDVPVFPESRRLLEEEGEDPGPERTVENTWTDLTQYGVGTAWVGEGGHLGASVKRTETSYGVPGHGHEEPAPGPGPAPDEEPVSIELEQTRWDVRGEFRAAFGPFETARFTAGLADYEHVELEGDEVGTRFVSEGIEGRLELIQAERDGWNGAVGVQALTRELDAIGDEAYVPGAEIGEIGVYTLQRVDRGGWGFEGGLRADRRELDSEAGSRAFDNVSASLGVFVRPNPDLFLGASLSRNARAPTEAELFAEGPHVATGAYEVGDAALESEIAYTLELTAHLERGRFDADVHAFTARYDGFVDLRPTGDEEDDLPVFLYRQTDATFHGFEAEAAWDLWREGERELKLEGAADFVRGDTDLGAPARVPPWSATGRLVYESPAWGGRLEVRRVGGQDRVAEFELPTDGYTLVNLFASWKPSPAHGLTLFAEARNLTDEEAREHASFLKDIAPLPGRSIRAGAVYRF
ncbi:MAG TPA: TonB-dependent receptor [Caulobacteraceae bacterium]|nr:TonB-dependent receptor [Caulobacteraceae bacterium]